jgi:hypothetical protein
MPGEPFGKIGRSVVCIFELDQKSHDGMQLVHQLSSTFEADPLDRISA